MKKSIGVVALLLVCLLMAGCGATKKQAASPKDALNEKLNRVVAMTKGTITEKSTSSHPKFGTEGETFTLSYEKSGKNIWYEMESTSTDVKNKKSSVAYKNEKNGYYVREVGQKKYTKLSDCNNAGYDDIMEILMTPVLKDSKMTVGGSDNQFTATQKDEKKNGKYSFTYSFTGDGVKVHVSQLSTNGKIKLECDYEVKAK